MFIYGKTAANAVSVMSYLAGLQRERLADSEEIASARGISRPMTAKLLSRLVKMGLVMGVAGQGGGYRIAREASSIRLMDIVSIFEQGNGDSPCPFGKDWCGKNNPCPLHDSITQVAEINHQFMRGTFLSEFSSWLNRKAKA